MSNPVPTSRQRRRASSDAPRPGPAPKAGGKRARTRAALLEAAAELFLSKGLFAASLDEIAARAGLTKGAIYGNFRDKDELIYAVAVERVKPPRLVFSPDVPLNQQLLELVRQTFPSEPASRRLFALRTQLDLYIMTHERLARRFRKEEREHHFKSAEDLERAPKDKPLPLPAGECVAAIHALLDGLVFQRAVLREVVSEEMALKALQAFLG